MVVLRMQRVVRVVVLYRPRPSAQQIALVLKQRGGQLRKGVKVPHNGRGGLLRGGPLWGQEHEAA